MPEITRSATEVAAMLDDGGEIAFLDVREIVPFGTSHPLLATHLALGQIECEIAWLLIDSRPRSEYRAANIPGSIDAPAGQMLRCFDDLVDKPTTKVVVNCMSRTRGILGGTSLVAAGVPNEVYVLLNGTRGWLLEGLVLERGATRFATTPSPQARQRARERASHLARRAGIRSIDRATLEQWRDDTTQTTYVFDVRDRDEYEAGHLDGARNAPEGALVMSPDHYIGTQHARCVLVDDDTVRATIAALWLSQMGRCTPHLLDGTN